MIHIVLNLNKKTRLVILDAQDPLLYHYLVAVLIHLPE
jgi:hypothetical protein